MTREEKASLAAEQPAWMYEFDLGDGIKTPLLADELRSIHETRAQMLNLLLDRVYSDGMGGRRCLDVGCNEGYFSHLLYHRGARVRGIDIREQNIRRARAVQCILELDPARIEFSTDDVFIFDANGVMYDLTLCLGLVYHLENPMGMLRRLRGMTRGVCLVESQVTRQRAAIASGWGQTGVTLELPASMGVFYEEQQAVDRLAAHGGLLSFVPNPAALHLMLKVAGFPRVVPLPARPGMNPQYLTEDRVIFAAFTAEGC
jgi:SAM-dependent methyltransferase